MISVTALPIETILERSTLSDTGAWISPSEGARDSAEGTRGSAHSRPPLSKRLPAATEALKLTTEAVPQKRKQRRSGSIIPLHLTPMIRHQRFEFIGHNSPGLQLRSARFAGTEKRDDQLRSEERRVGKECRARWRREHQNNENDDQDEEMRT